jgi:hypothetical protein
METGMPNAGIVYLGRRDGISEAATGNGYVESTEFRTMFDAWADEVRAKVFFGYCSKAQATADAVIEYLVRGVRVEIIDWSVDFAPGVTIMDEISITIRSSRCGLFVFTKDDPLEGDARHAAPRGFCLATQWTISFRQVYLPNGTGEAGERWRQLHKTLYQRTSTRQV